VGLDSAGPLVVRFHVDPEPVDLEISWRMGLHRVHRRSDVVDRLSETIVGVGVGVGS
jgi:hypothetical protein